MNPQHWLAPDEFPSVPPDAELGNFLLDFILINLLNWVFIEFYKDEITWKLLLWSSVSMLRTTELRELKVLFSVRTGHREICGNYCVTLYLFQFGNARSLEY